MTEIGFGIFCTNGDGTLSTNHTFRLKNLTFERVFEAFNANLRDLFRLLELCKEENIEVFRLGSNFIPYASHKYFKDEWILKIEPYIRDAGKKVKEKFNIRITMHPGQFVVLNSLNKEVVENSLRELNYHFWLLDKLDLGRESIVIIHVGGIYSNKEKAIERFINIVEKNGWLKRRLAIENDEKFFNAKEVLRIAKILNIPFVFDYFHHTLNSSKINLDEAFRTWHGKGIPKLHLSSQGKGRLGVHGDYVELKDFLVLKKMVDETGIEKVHLMIEAKKKEIALRDLKEKLFRFYL